MKRVIINLPALLITAVLGCAVVWAQAVSTAQITGTVKDQTGAVLPGVEITVTQTDTGAKRTVLTDETGLYALPNLPIGPYRLEAALPGFRTYVQSGIVLQVNSNPSINVAMEIGQVSEQIEVQANAALVETRSVGISQMIDNQRILELPLNGRQAADLILLSAGTTPSTGNAMNSNNRNYPTQIISITGGLSNGTTFLLDGGTHNDPYNNLNIPFPFPDALQEFKVETSALPAQYGQHSAGAVNAVTKSGTNALHGDLFEFVRNGSLNARNAFAASRDSLKRNQFGGTLGGPIVKNKLFFFGGYQGTTLRSNPTTNREFIPTQAMLAGDFTAFTSPACNGGRQITLKAPFVNNTISPSQFSAQALNLVKRLPATANPCGEIAVGRRAVSNEYLLLGRADYQWMDRHSVSGRFQQARLHTLSDYDGQNILSLSTAETPQRVDSFVLGDTYLIGNNTVSNFRATLNRAKNPLIPPPFFDYTDLGINMHVLVPKYSRTAVSGGFTIPAQSTYPSHYNWTTFQFAQDLSMIHGAHQFGFGANFIRSLFNYATTQNAAASFTFNGQTTGSGLADFLIGRPSSFTQGSPVGGHFRQNVFGMYAQDTWKLSARLTLSGGLRWDPFFSVSDKHGIGVHFDKNGFDQGLNSTVYRNAPAGLTFPGDPGYPGNSPHRNRLAQFAPRLGLVWDPAGDGRMTIRSAYGILYDMPHFFYYHTMARILPFGNLLTVTSPTGGFANPWQDYPGGDPFPLVIDRNAQFQTGGSYPTYPFDVHAPYSEQWNLSIQRQIGSDWLVSANYIGSNTIHMWIGREANPVIYLPGASCVIAGRTFAPCSSTTNSAQRRLLSLQNPGQGPYYSGGISELDDGGTASYNGLQLSLQRRSSNGLTVQGNYTYSHCISDLLNQQLGTMGENYQIYDNRRYDRGNCAVQDIRHVINVSTVYATPRFSNGTLRLLAGNWQVSGIARLRTGSNFSVSSGLDTSLTGKISRADQVLANPYAANKTIEQWLNPAAFAAPVTGTLGNMGRNTLAGPRFVQIDVGLSRTFAIREDQTLQFRVEAFNLPNHVNPNNPAATLNAPNFGRISAGADSRILQFALKYAF